MALAVKEIVSSWIKSVSPSEALRQINEICDKRYSISSVYKWSDKSSWPPPQVIQYVIDIEQRIAEDWDHNLPWEGERLRICMPIYRSVDPRTFKAVFILRSRHQGKIGLDVQMGSITAESRNWLATRFLEGDANWMLMMDDDMVPPVGHPGQLHSWGARFDANYMKFDVITRLVGQKKTLISALCFGRGGDGMPMYREGRNDPREAEWARGGPYDIVKETEWFGGGCFLCHRTVLETILSKTPDIRSDDTTNRPHQFFAPLLNHGEDASFCVRAKVAGIQPFIDMGCIVGHVGNWTFWNKKVL